MGLEKLLDDGFQLVFDEFEKLIHTTERAPVLDRKFKKVVDDISELVPEYLYWPVRDATPVIPLRTNRFADGGNLENSGVASLLSYSDIDNVISFLNSATPIRAVSKGVIDANGIEIPGTRIEVDSQVPPLFRYQAYDENEGYRLYRGSINPDSPESKFNQVFESSMFANFLIQMWKNSGNLDSPGSFEFHGFYGVV